MFKVDLTGNFIEQFSSDIVFYGLPHSKFAFCMINEYWSWLLDSEYHDWCWEENIEIINETLTVGEEIQLVTRHPVTRKHPLKRSYTVSVYFKTEEDAIHFKLRWS